MEMYCNDCGARFRNQCTCRDQPPVPTKQERWVGIDGHAYVGDSRRASSAYHDTANCRCPGSAKHNPDEWY